MNRKQVKYSDDIAKSNMQLLHSIQAGAKNRKSLQQKQKQSESKVAPVNHVKNIQYGNDQKASNMAHLLSLSTKSNTEKIISNKQNLIKNDILPEIDPKFTNRSAAELAEDPVHLQQLVFSFCKKIMENDAIESNALFGKVYRANALSEFLKLSPRLANYAKSLEYPSADSVFDYFQQLLLQSHDGVIYEPINPRLLNINPKFVRQENKDYINFLNIIDVNSMNREELMDAYIFFKEDPEIEDDIADGGYLPLSPNKIKLASIATLRKHLQEFVDEARAGSEFDVFYDEDKDESSNVYTDVDRRDVIKNNLELKNANQKYMENYNSATTVLDELIERAASSADHQVASKDAIQKMLDGMYKSVDDHAKDDLVSKNQSLLDSLVKDENNIDMEFEYADEELLRYHNSNQPKDLEEALARYEEAKQNIEGLFAGKKLSRFQIREKEKRLRSLENEHINRLRSVENEHNLSLLAKEYSSRSRPQPKDLKEADAIYEAEKQRIEDLYVGKILTRQVKTEKDNLLRKAENDHANRLSVLTGKGLSKKKNMKQNQKKKDPRTIRAEGIIKKLLKEM